MRKKLSHRLYRIIRWLVWLFYPKTAVEGVENLPDKPCVVVGNHAQMHGPIACELYFPVERYTWCAGEMMHLKEVPQYAFTDFWSKKPASVRWFFKLLSYVIAPFSACVFTNANCIGVYHDMRIASTFKESVRKLQEGASIVIFPEHYEPYSNIVCEFRDRFIDLGRMYCRRTGEELDFVPFYMAPALKKLYLGKPIRFNPDAPLEEERKRICGYLQEEVTRMAQALPEHTVVPYANVPKKLYPKNTDQNRPKED